MTESRDVAGLDGVLAQFRASGLRLCGVQTAIEIQRPPLRAHGFLEYRGRNNYR